MINSFLFVKLVGKPGVRSYPWGL